MMHMKTCSAPSLNHSACLTPEFTMFLSSAGKLQNNKHCFTSCAALHLPKFDDIWFYVRLSYPGWALLDVVTHLFHSSNTVCQPHAQGSLRLSVRVGLQSLGHTHDWIQPKGVTWLLARLLTPIQGIRPCCTPHTVSCEDGQLSLHMDTGVQQSLNSASFQDAQQWVCWADSCFVTLS